MAPTICSSIPAVARTGAAMARKLSMAMRLGGQSKLPITTTRRGVSGPMVRAATRVPP